MVNSNTMLIMLIFPLAFMVGVVFLQIFLSKKQNKFLGLVLPILSLLFSLLMLYNMGAYTTSTESTLVQGEPWRAGSAEPPSSEAQEVTTQTRSEPPEGFFLSMIVVFLISNIPTVVLVVLYLACREKIKRNRELDKMTLQDLS